MSKFLAKLRIELMVNCVGIPLANRSGRQLYQLFNSFDYVSDYGAQVIRVPAGFITDFASVPRVPFVYDTLGDLAQMPAVIHDYLYSTGKLSRLAADQILLEAMTITAVPWAKRQLIYYGVRMGGANNYNNSKT